MKAVAFHGIGDIDTIPDRLEMARDQGAEAIKDLTDGMGADRVIDAVGVDAEPAGRGPSADYYGHPRGRKNRAHHFSTTCTHSSPRWPNDFA